MIDAYEELGETPTSSRSRKCRPTRRTCTASSASASSTGKAFEITGMVEKPPQRQGAVEPHHLGALHPAAGDFRHSGESGARRGRRNPAHRRDDRALPRRAPFYGYKFDGRTFDCGSKIGFLAANVAYALDARGSRAGFTCGAEEAVGIGHRRAGMSAVGGKADVRRECRHFDPLQTSAGISACTCEADLIACGTQAILATVRSQSRC